VKGGKKDKNSKTVRRAYKEKHRNPIGQILKKKHWKACPQEGLKKESQKMKGGGKSSKRMKKESPTYSKDPHRLT